MTDRPIIGVLAQDTNRSISAKYPRASSHISAAYVKAVEASGARVVPIFIGQGKSYYKDMVNSLNGFLLAGEAETLSTRSGYGAAGKMIVKHVKKANDRGIHLPIFGVCLGFELLMYLDARETDLRRNVFCREAVLPLELRFGVRAGKLYTAATDQLMNILEAPVAPLYNNFCITEEDLEKYKVSQKWSILSVSRCPSNNQYFVTSIESIKYPFAAVQFHPEMCVYDWNRKFRHLHTPKGMTMSRFYYDWLVAEAKLNANRFPNNKREAAALIFNYPVTHTARVLLYDQMYFF